MQRFDVGDCGTTSVTRDNRLRLKTLTLGCKVNQYETEYVRQSLLEAGYRSAADGERADLCVVNTCTVTATGDAKSRQAIRRLARDNPQARIVVMGCYATRAPAEVAQLPHVVEVVTDKRELPDLLGRFGVVDPPDGISRFGDRQRAYIKVQDGCLLRCSYCIIPYVRPHMSSRPLESICAETRRLLAAGYREIVLTGIHLGHYGVDKNVHRSKSEWIRLSDLVRQLACIDFDGDWRIRLSSIEATEVTRELLDVMAAFPQRVCPHLHICLQSGSDHILGKMRRRWGVQRFIDRCRLVKGILDSPALTTDVMVGFPGESEADFQATCEVVREVGFCKLHIFPFSPRRGTPAAQLPDQVTAEVKGERVERLGQIERVVRHRYQESLLGQRLHVLAESTSDDVSTSSTSDDVSTSGDPWSWTGTSCRYLPVECRPLEPGHRASPRLGELVPVTIEDVQGGNWVGKVAMHG